MPGRYRETAPDGRGLRRPAATVLAVVAVAAVFAASCSFAPSVRQGPGAGPSSNVMRIGEESYRIDLDGIESSSRRGAVQLLLRRCAEVTLEQGYDHFVVAGGEVVGENELEASPLASLGGGGEAEPDGGPARVVRRYRGTALFRVSRGAAPEGNPLAFDARRLTR